MSKLKQVSIMLEPKDKEALRSLAQYYGLDMTNFIRKVIASRKAKSILEGGNNGQKQKES